MLVRIGEKPESDFTQPLGLLSDCHKRIRYFLNMMVAVAGEAGDAPLAQEQRRYLENALRYFREAAPKHTADEEQSLFWRMRYIASSRVDEVLSKMEDLEADHRWADRQHSDVDAIVRKWITEGVLPETDRSLLKTLLSELSGLYDRHIALEETEIFPLAEAILPEEEKRAIGCEMAQRRGIVFENGRTNLL
jgi:hemerythrin-like domain-containing protein